MKTINTNSTSKSVTSNSNQSNWIEIFDHVPVGLVVWQADGKAVRLNRYFESMFGYDIKEVPNANAWFDTAYPNEVYREEIRSKWFSNIDKYLYHNKQFEPITAEVTCKNNTTKIIEFGFENINDVFLSTFTDVTRTKEFEKNLRNTTDRYKALFKSSGDAVVVFKDGKIIDFNDQALILFDANHDQLKNVAPWELSPDYQPDGSDSKTKAKERIDTALEGRVAKFDWVHQTMNGKLVDTEISLNIIDEVHQIGVGTIRDVSERKKTERFLNQLIESLPGIFFMYEIVGDDAKLIKWNNNHALLTGYSHEELAGVSPFIFGHTETDEEKMVEGMERLANGMDTAFEMDLKRKDGSRLPISVSATTMIGEGKTYFFGFCIDISERTKAMNDLLQSEKVFRSFMENIPVLTYMKDENLKPIYTNHKIKSLNQQDVDDSETLKIEEADQELLSGNSNYVELEYQTIIDDQLRWLRDIKFLIPFEDGSKVIGGAALDITTIKNYQKMLMSNQSKLERVIQELKSSNQKLGEYAFINAHKLRVPVANIKGIIQLFDGTKSTDETLELINLLKGQSENLDQVLYDIKDMLEKDQNEYSEIIYNQ